jgi:hypothetical protein
MNRIHDGKHVVAGWTILFHETDETRLTSWKLVIHIAVIAQTEGR